MAYPGADCLQVAFRRCASWAVSTLHYHVIEPFIEKELLIFPVHSGGKQIRIELLWATGGFIRGL